MVTDAKGGHPEFESRLAVIVDTPDGVSAAVVVCMVIKSQHRPCPILPRGVMNVLTMKILLLGGTGLISTAITKALIARGDEVVLHNRGRTPHRFEESPNVRVITGDRKDRATFEAAFEGETFDVVVDMIAYHIDDTLSALRALSGKFGQFVHTSTVCVTSGRPVHIPMTESEPYHSVGQYGWNKAAIEEHLLKLHADEGVPVTIMRPSHSYGEGGGILRPFGPWESFVARLRAGRKLIVPGDGTGLWAACHVDDVAQGFLATFGNPKAFGEVFHITGDEWHTWDHYHQAVADVVGGTYSPVYMPSDVLAKCAPKWSGGLREIFQWTSVFDNDKLKALGYPGHTISFAEGTKRTLAWMERDGRLADIEGDDFEDKLIAAWEHATAELPVMPKPD